MTILRLEVDGIQTLNRAFDTLGKTISDWRDAWPEIEQIFFRAELEQFDTEGARSGAKWQPLSAAYARWKQIRFPGAPILVRTGRLKRSLSVSGVGTDDSIREHEPTSLTLGSRVPYAIYHQRGGRRLPKREPINLTLRDAGRITSRMFRFAERGARGAGFQLESARLPLESTRLPTAGE